VREELRRLVGLALACGAAQTGGPLSEAEIELARRAIPASAAEVRRVRAAICDGPCTPQRVY